MAIPDTNTFSLQDVCDELIKGGPNDLVDCFNVAQAYRFDPNYEGNKDRLSNFRNYDGIWIGKILDYGGVSPAGTSQSWNTKNQALSTDLIGHDVQIIFKYITGSSSTRGSYRSNFQIGGVIGIGEDTYDLDNNQSPQWQTSTTVNTTDINNVTWSDIPNSDTTINLRWNRYGPSTTPRSLTGIAAPTGGPDKYYYTETGIGSVPSKNIWLKSPTSTITSTNRNLSFDYAGYGSNIGDLRIYLKVIS